MRVVSSLFLLALLAVCDARPTDDAVTNNIDVKIKRNKLMDLVAANHKAHIAMIEDTTTTEAAKVEKVEETTPTTAAETTQAVTTTVTEVTEEGTEATQKTKKPVDVVEEIKRATEEAMGKVEKKEKAVSSETIDLGESDEMATVEETVKELVRILGGLGGEDEEEEKKEEKKEEKEEMGGDNKIEESKGEEKEKEKEQTEQKEEKKEQKKPRTTMRPDIVVDTVNKYASMSCDLCLKAVSGIDYDVVQLKNAAADMVRLDCEALFHGDAESIGTCTTVLQQKIEEYYKKIESVIQAKHVCQSLRMCAADKPDTF